MEAGFKLKWSKHFLQWWRRVFALMLRAPTLFYPAPLHPTPVMYLCQAATTIILPCPSHMSTNSSCINLNPSLMF